MDGARGGNSRRGTNSQTRPGGADRLGREGGARGAAPGAGGRFQTDPVRKQKTPDLAFDLWRHLGQRTVFALGPARPASASVLPAGRHWSAELFPAAAKGAGGFWR